MKLRFESAETAELCDRVQSSWHDLLSAGGCTRRGQSGSMNMEQMSLCSETQKWKQLNKQNLLTTKALLRPEEPLSSCQHPPALCNSTGTPCEPVSHSHTKHVEWIIKPFSSTAMAGAKWLTCLPMPYYITLYNFDCEKRCWWKGLVIIQWGDKWVISSAWNLKALLNNSCMASG